MFLSSNYIPYYPSAFLMLLGLGMHWDEDPSWLDSQFKIAITLKSSI